MKKIIILITILLLSCSSGLPMKIFTPKGNVQWKSPYVSGMNGVENIAFDSKGFMYVTGLKGMIYKIKHDIKSNKGIIVKKVKAGAVCTGIVALKDRLYVAFQSKKGGDLRGKIYHVTSELKIKEALTNEIEGLNALLMSSSGKLYFASSNMSFINPKGYVGVIDINNKESFKKPQKLLVGKMLNGLAFSPDEITLYYTETTGGLYSFDMNQKTRKLIFEPKGFLQILDDLTVDSKGNIWLCFNSEMSIVKISPKGKTAYRFGSLKVPSSCVFGKGPGFSQKVLYITEFGQKSRSMTMDGRGVWAIPVYKLIK